MIDLIRALNAALAEGQDVIFCSLVETRGSTPQKAGAAMLVRADARQVGTLGGGCVEAEVKRRALRLLGQDQPELLRFDLDDTYGWDDGLICGGRMQVLAEPLRTPSSPGYFRAYHDLLDQGAGCTEAIVLDPSRAGGAILGARFLFAADGRLIAGHRAAEPPPGVVEGLTPLAQRPRPRTVRGVSFLPTPPRVRLVIVGGGHVGQAVAALAAQAEFEVWVIDDRESYVTAERFPTARRRIVGPVDQVLPGLPIDHRTYVLIVTRGHNHDEEALFHTVATPAAYVGMIGSKRKVRLIFDDLRAQGIPAAALERVHAPVGLDIGSQTVPEIAVSIVAELIAQRNLGHPAPARIE